MTIPSAAPRLTEATPALRTPGAVAASGLDEATPIPARTRVVAIPSAHPYVRRVGAGAGVELHDDPAVPGAPAGVWWPPQALQPEWIRAHSADADLLHIHFGTESFAPGHLTACIDAAHDAGWPVVYTAHDLTHPQLSDQRPYLAQLDELVPRVDAVVTLTEAAAAEIRQRWQREAVVLPHPSILGDRPAPAFGTLGEEHRIGVHLKDLRPGTDGPGTVRAVLDAVTRLRERGTPTFAEIRMQRSVRDDEQRESVRRELADHPHALLIEQERLPDDELFAALAGLDACVLPYRAGTHSGWLEMCWDLGVPVAAPTVGHFGDQHPGDGVTRYEPGDAASLADALAQLWSSAAGARPGSLARSQLIESRREHRRTTDAATAAQHAELYARLRRERAA